MGDQDFEPSVREFDFPDDTVYRIAVGGGEGVEVVRIPKRLAQEHEDKMNDELNLNRERLQIIYNEADRMFKYACHTETVVGRIGCQFWYLPQNAVIALSKQWYNDWAFLGKLFAIEELHELHKTIVTAYINDDIKEGEEAWKLAIHVYDSLVADLIVIHDILVKLAHAYSQNRLALHGPDEGIPIGAQKEWLPQKVVKIEQWVIGLPSNQAMMMCECTAAQAYDLTMIVPIGGFKADQFQLYLWDSDAMKAKDQRDEAQQAEHPAEPHPEHPAGEFNPEILTIDPRLLTLPTNGGTIN